MVICVYGAASKEIAEPFKEAGHALGYELAKRGHSLVFGGGDHGMMGAVARGTHDGGGHITGIQPSFFNVDGVLYPLCDEYIYTDTMRERKQKMEELSDGFIVSPNLTVNGVRTIPVDFANSDHNPVRVSITIK